MQTPPPREPSVGKTDTLGVVEKEREVRQASVLPSPKRSSRANGDSLGRYFSHLATGREKVLTVKTDLYTANISTKGGLIKKWELSRYQSWDGHPVQMVDPDRDGDLGLLFLSSDGKEIRTRSLYFDSDYTNGSRVELTGDQTFTATLVLAISGTQRILKKLTFKNGTYDLSAEIELYNLADVISNFEYQVTWETGIRYAEQNSIDESSFAMAYAYSGGELAEVDATSFEETAKRDINGATSWVAMRNKYFATALIAADGLSQGAYLEGYKVPQPDKGEKEEYSMSLKMPFKGMLAEKAKITIFLGPLDFDIITGYEIALDQIISLGATWIIRPISEYVMIPLFNLLHFFIPNYGIVIIVFSIIIKVVLHPLSKTTMKSMRKMQALQPMMNELREKYKDDPQKMNQQVMNLYKEYGVNPAAGCVPLILQMPILFALYSVFRSAIELRQAGFVWWMSDLSVPDEAFVLPSPVPLLGIQSISGLALAMGITMFIQQKMTVTDPRQKAMVWMMPIMMTIIFNGLPAGLNLYYFVFNLLSIAQQAWLSKHHGSEPLRKVEKKAAGGLMGRLTKQLPKVRR